MSYLGEDIPKLGFGLMRLPKADGQTDVKQVKEMVDLFMDAGFTYFDTARIYKGSEEAIREALVERYPRESYQLATKLTAWAGCKTAEDARAMFYNSLEATGAGYFDFYLLHNFGGPRTAPYDDFDLWNFCGELKKQGLIRHLGISIHGTADELAAILDAHGDQVEFVQFQLNWGDWEDDAVQSRKLYELCIERGLPIVVMEPVKGGILLDPPTAVRELLEAANPACSLPAWALRFAADRPGLITVLSGMSSVQQMRDNIATFKPFVPLSPAESDAIARAQELMQASGLIQCTSCDYCAKACPNDILISGIFLTMNRLRKFPESLNVCKGTYGWYAMQGSKASDCIECCACEAACPQQLPITNLLKEAVELFETGEPAKSMID